jgi:predicted amidohydrolase
MMRVAGVQMDVELGAVAANLGRMERRLAEAAGHGAKLVVFPECAATGYCFESVADAREVAQPIPGPITERMSQLCHEHGTYAAFGMVELDADRLFNAAVLVGPEGVLGSYRKIHLPYLGLDMFTTPGDRLFRVDHVGNVRVGMTICYDGSFPESTRSLALLGADLILLPTNWPPGAETTAEYVTNARAVENNVYFMAVNRVGTERGFRFIGHSKIADPHGNTLAEARGTDEQILYAEIDPHLARRKHLVRVPGKHEIDRMADRRPEMYGLLTEPHHLRSPGR